MCWKGGKMKALLMVDVQNDFCPGGALAVSDGDQVVGPLNKMVSYATKDGWLIVASRDWHPAVTNHFKDYGGIWPVHCIQYTHGAQFQPDLMVKSAMIVSKATKPDEDGYSAFDGQLSNGQSLISLLKMVGVTEVYVGGLATDYCVKASALDAAKSGFVTKLLFDACRAVNLQPDDEQKAIAEMQAAGVEVITTNEVINA